VSIIYIDGRKRADNILGMFEYTLVDIEYTLVETTSYLYRPDELNL
jgi:hypothetical protein